MASYSITKSILKCTVNALIFCSVWPNFTRHSPFIYMCNKLKSSLLFDSLIFYYFLFRVLELVSLFNLLFSSFELLFVPLLILLTPFFFLGKFTFLIVTIYWVFYFCFFYLAFSAFLVVYCRIL